MSVFTRVDSAELADFLESYDIGEARLLEPIAAGVTNSNYRLDTAAGDFILTLYEHHAPRDLAYILGLQRHLAGNGVRCARPVIDRQGRLFKVLNQRPAAIIERLPGAVAANPDLGQCAAIGAELARFHLAGAGYSARRINPRGQQWILSMREMLRKQMDDSGRSLIDDVLGRVSAIDPATLPAGAIHADLFHDNAMFMNGELGGIFDFDYACHDNFCFDIAVLLNDWCIDGVGELIPARVNATLAAYRAQRALLPTEMRALPAMLAFTALRFWLSRLHDLAFPLTGDLVLVKPPEEYRNIAELRLAARLDLFTDAKSGEDPAE
ncbi:MAG: homoserine kinase [Gammaproteobacteria bacterium]|nr:homoserine kinase [Gammaproteobacteria bacterium]